MFARLATILLACYLLAVTGVPTWAGMPFSWQEAYAKVLPHGDLEWAPGPFRFEQGASLRYIDFDTGDDENDGTKQAPWKHHPWDSQATGKAKLCRGIHTYVFKGGVDYRGDLTVREAGKSGDPIRLTRDPGWGQGPAVLCGSERITGWKKGATHRDIPEPEKVWWADFNFAPRSVWLVRKQGDFLRIPLARTPNWKRANPDDVKSDWWVWDNPGKPFGNTIKNAAGQQVHLGIDTQNTAYNFHESSRRQEPGAGRNKYLGNIWDGMGQYVFRHADPARTEAEGKSRDAGPQRGHFALETNAYGRNVFHDFAGMGVLEPSGRWLLTFDDFKGALQKNHSLLGELGEVSKTAPLRDPARGDFRPAKGAAGIDKGVEVFVPWALSGVVGEWNFYPAGDDPTDLIDEHWYMTDYHVSREGYRQRPMYPLKGVNVTREDYVPGPLEDWIAGALSFSPARKQYAMISHTEMMRPFSFLELKKSRHENAKPEPCTIEGEALKNPQIYTSNLLIEVYFKTAPGHTGGVLMEKMKGNGYGLAVGAAGKLSFTVKGPGASATAESQAKVNDGQWHHAVVEADRGARTLTVYVDGKKAGSVEGVDASVRMSLRAAAGLLRRAGVTGAPVVDEQGRCVGMLSAVDFLRGAEEGGAGAEIHPLRSCPYQTTGRLLTGEEVVICTRVRGVAPCGKYGP